MIDKMKPKIAVLRSGIVFVVCSGAIILFERPPLIQAVVVIVGNELLAFTVQSAPEL